jgi:hypothetical protein
MSESLSLFADEEMRSVAKGTKRMEYVTYFNFVLLGSHRNQAHILTTIETKQLSVTIFVKKRTIRSRSSWSRLEYLLYENHVIHSLAMYHTPDTPE